MEKMVSTPIFNKGSRKVKSKNEREDGEGWDTVKIPKQEELTN